MVLFVASWQTDLHKHDTILLVVLTVQARTFPRMPMNQFNLIVGIRSGIRVCADFCFIRLWLTFMLYS